MSHRAEVRRSALPALVAGLLLAFTVLLGGSEVGVFLAPFQVINAVIGGALVAWWMLLLRRGSDAVDGLAVAGLLAFVLACALAVYPRQAFDAAVAALVWTAAFGVGRRLLGHPANRLLALRLLGLCGLVLASAFAVYWGSRWLAWIQLAGGLPPLDLSLPPHIYRHYYVVAMLLAALLPASVFLLRDRALRIPAGVTIVLTLGLTVLSGSRTVWLALVVAGVAALVLARPSRRMALSLVGVAAALAVLAVASGLVATAADRLLAGGTVTYRLDIWRSAIGLWSEHPITGVGPGSVGIALTLSDLTDVYPFTNRHTDNAFVQLAAEGGALGLFGGALAVLAVVSGRRAALPGSGTAAVALVSLAAMALTNNPTDSPNLVALIVCYAALLAPLEPDSSRPVARDRPLRSAIRVGTLACAAVVALAVVSVNVAAVHQAGARTALASGSPDEADHRLALAELFDPGLALYRRDRGILLMDSDPVSAARELERAVTMNPADVAAWRALALLNAADGKTAGAMTAATSATDVHPLSPENWLTVALVSSGEGRIAATGEVLRLAPWLPGSAAWPEALADPGALAASFEAAADASSERPLPRGELAPMWLAVTTDGAPAVPASPELEALQSIFACDLPGANAALEAAGPDWVRSTAGVVARVMLARLRVEPGIEDVLAQAGLRQPDLATAARGVLAPYAIVTNPAQDAQLYRRLGVGPIPGQVVIPRTPDALGSWMVDPGEAARRATPDAALAMCD